MVFQQRQWLLLCQEHKIIQQMSHTVIRYISCSVIVDGGHSIMITYIVPHQQYLARFFSLCDP